MADSTRDMLYEQLVSTRESLGEVWDAHDHAHEHEPYGPELERDGCETCAAFPEELGEVPMEYLDELPLEIVWEKGEPFAVVLGTGGPHVEIRGGGRHDGSGYTLHGYWGGEHVTLSGEAITRTGEYFRELVEGGE